MNCINSYTPSLFWDQLLSTETTAEELAEMASNAIFSSELQTLKLQGLLQQGLVDAMTHTAAGETLLALAVRIDKPQAFEDLVQDFPEFRAAELNQQDGNGGTLLHEFARHRLPNDFAPGIQANWRRILRNFLDAFNTKLDWSLRNKDGDTALELATRLGMSHLAGMMKSYSGKSTPS